MHRSKVPRTAAPKHVRSRCGVAAIHTDKPFRNEGDLIQGLDALKIYPLRRQYRAGALISLDNARPPALSAAVPTMLVGLARCPGMEHYLSQEAVCNSS